MNPWNERVAQLKRQQFLSLDSQSISVIKIYYCQKNLNYRKLILGSSFILFKSNVTADHLTQAPWIFKLNELIVMMPESFSPSVRLENSLRFLQMVCNSTFILKYLMVLETLGFRIP